MPSIDERVVSMAFENAKFEAGVAQTMASLGKLDTAIKNIGSTNGLDNIEKAANKVTLQQPMSALDKLKSRFGRAGNDAAQGMSDIERAGNKVQLEQPIRALNKVQSETAQVGRSAADGFNDIERASNRVALQGLNSALDSVTAKFSTLQAAASVALGNIASQGIAKGAAFSKGFAFGPIKQGFEEYQTNLSSIQTIMANTEGQRVSGLKETNKHLQELNTYSDQTIYNFSQMAKNIGTFTAAGVDLDTSTKSIKGIANLAALSGSNSQQASTAMYQLSQAIAAGRVGLQDWNSVVNAGMGGRKFQNSLIQTAVAMGKIPEEAVKIDKATGKATINGEGFRQSIMAAPGKESWLTSDVLTSSLSQFTGDMSDAELKAKGFTAEQIKSIQATAKSAKEAATQVKTLPQLFDVTREAIGSGWAITFQNIFGDFKQSKQLFTGISVAINGFVAQHSAARNKVLGEWNKQGGRAALIEGLKNAFQALFAILKPIGQAFRDVFPAKTGKDLIEMTKHFRDFTAGLKPGAATIDGIRRTARGFFAVLHIGWSIVKGVIGVIGDLLGVVGEGSGGFLNFTGSIGDFLVAVDDALTKGGLLTSFFDAIAKALKVPLQLLGGVASAIFGLFGGIDSSGADKMSGSMGKVSSAAGPLANALDQLKGAWDGLILILRDAKDFWSPWLDKIGEQFSRIGDVIAQAFQGENFDHIMTTLQTGFIGGIFLAIKKGIGGGIAGGLTKSLNGVNGVLGALTGNLKAMQQNVKANTLLQIAAAIGLLAASTFTLSKIDAKDLAKAMTAIAVGLGQLMGAMKLMTGGLGMAAIVQLPILAASLVVMAGAMVVLAGAVKIFSTMSWEEIAKGLVGVGGGLAAIGVGMKFLGPGTLIQAPAILLLSVALNALALAVKQFASLSWEELGRGLAGVLGVLVALIAPITEAGPMLLPAAAGLVGIAFAMNLLAGAVLSFGSMDPGKMAIGIGGIALALVALSAAAWAFPPTLPLTAAGLVILGVALSGIAGALAMFSKIGVGGMAKGLIGMGAALLILAVGLSAMSGTLLGGVALMAAAAALAVLAPTLAFMGTLNWGTIFKGLAAMVLVLGTLSIVGLVASEGLIALGVSLLPLAGVFLLTAGALFIFAKALSLLGEGGGKGIGIMVAAITGFLAILPKIVIDFAKGLLSIYEELAKIAPQVVEALVKILDSIIEVVIRSAPRLALAIGSLIDGFLLVVNQKSPDIIRAGWQLLLNLLKGVDNNISKVITQVASIVGKFLSGLAQQAPHLVAGGARLIVAFLNGVSKHVGDITNAGVRVVANFLRALYGLPAKIVVIVANGMIKFLNAIAKKIPDIVNAAVHLAGKFLKGLSSGMVRITRLAADALIDFLNGFADAIHDKAPEIRKAGWHVVREMINGMLDGFKELWHKVAEKMTQLADKIPWPIRKALKILSPSRVMMDIGKNVVLGLAIGIGDHTPKVMQAMSNLADATKSGAIGGLSGISAALVTTLINPLGAMVHQNKSMKEFGQFLGNEFRDGLTGGLWDKNNGKSQAVVQIEDTFKSLETKLSEERAKLRDKVKQDQSKFDELLAADKPNTAKIQKAYEALTRSRTALVLSSSSSSMFMKSLQDEKSALTKLADEYDLVTKQLAKAQEVFNQFDVLPDFTKLVDDAVAEAAMTGSERWEAIRKEQDAKDARNRVNQVALYKQSLEQQIAATTKYMETLAKLRDAGLDDQTYQKLLEQGTAGQEFASQLLSSGKKGIDSINKLDSQLAAASSKVAENAAKALVKAGDQAAQGLITGLQNRQAEIRKVMEDIAKTMIKSIKTQLMIRSPSRIFAEIGRFSVQGLADGLKESSSLVSDAASNVGDEAADALTSSLANISDRIQNGVDTDLTITPVLDLTQVQKDASKIQDLTNVTPITAAASYGQAAAISQESQASDAAQAAAEPKVIEFNFEQTNTSPKALDDIEIYRKTNNQLSQVKSALGLAT